MGEPTAAEDVALATPADDMTRLTAFVKAYDVRGLVGVS